MPHLRFHVSLVVLTVSAAVSIVRAQDPEMTYPPERGRAAIAQTYAALLDDCTRVVAPKTIFDRLPGELNAKIARAAAKAHIIPHYTGDRARDLLALQRFPERLFRSLGPDDRDGQPNLTFGDVMNAMKDASDDCVSFDYDDADETLDKAIGFPYTDTGLSTAYDAGMRESHASDVVPHSPAARAGITTGDRIVSLQSDPEKRNAPERVTFEHGAMRHVTVLEPKRLFNQTVFPRTPTARVGLLRLSGIGPNTTTEFSEARAALVASGHTALVVDLRDVKRADAPSARALASVLVPTGITATMTIRGGPVPFATGGVTDAIPTAILIDDETDAAALLVADAAHRGGATLLGSSQSASTDLIAYRKLPSTTIMRVVIGEAARANIDLASDRSHALALDPALGLDATDADDPALRTAIAVLSEGKP